MSRATGLATAWQADADGDVQALGLRGDTLYVADRFDTLDGQARGTLGAFNATTANLLPWSPSTDGTSNTILIGEQTAFVGGEWENFNGIPSAGPREVGLIQGANPPFVGPFVGSILALATSPTRLFVGGDLRGIGDGRGNFFGRDPSASITN